jgi:hypothetical protein
MTLEELRQVPLFEFSKRALRSSYPPARSVGEKVSPSIICT